jgi:hypothetical protein
MIDAAHAGSMLAALASEVTGNESPSSIAERFERFVTLEELALPLPGGGSTRLRFSMLRQVGACDLSLARLVEGHFDAIAILAEAKVPAPRGKLGVWAAVRTDGWGAVASGQPFLDQALVILKPARALPSWHP